MKIKLIISFSFNFSFPAELLTVVTLFCQLFGNWDRINKAWTSSSNKIPTEVSWFTIMLNSLKCDVQEYSFAILRLKSFFIRYTLFTADSYPFIFASTTIRSTVIFSFNILLFSDVFVSDNRICLIAFLSRIAQFSSDSAFFCAFLYPTTIDKDLSDTENPLYVTSRKRNPNHQISQFFICPLLNLWLLLKPSLTLIPIVEINRIWEPMRNKSTRQIERCKK